MLKLIKKYQNPDGGLVHANDAIQTPTIYPQSEKTIAFNKFNNGYFGQMSKYEQDLVKKVLDQLHFRTSTSEIRRDPNTGQLAVGLNGSMIGDAEWSPERIWMETAVGKPLELIINPILHRAGNAARNGMYNTVRYLPGTAGTTARHWVASRALSSALNLPLDKATTKAAIEAALATKTKSGPLGGGLLIANGRIVDSSGVEYANILQGPFKLNGEWYNYSGQPRMNDLLKDAEVLASEKKNLDIITAYTKYAKDLGIDESHAADAKLIELWAQDEASDAMLARLGIDDIPTFRKEGVPSRHKHDFYKLDSPIAGYADKGLTTEEIFEHLGQTTKPVEAFSLDTPELYKFLKEDSLPRLIRNLEREGIDFNAYPGLKDEITDLYTNPLKYYTSIQDWISPRYGGLSAFDGTITYPRGTWISPSTVFHENHHSLRGKVAELLNKRGIKMPDIDLFDDLASKDYDMWNWYLLGGRALYTKAELDAMRLGKGFDFDVRKSLIPDNEIGATTAESRFKWALEHPDAEGNILYGDALDSALDAAQRSGELGEWVYLLRPSYTSWFEDLNFDKTSILEDPKIKQAVSDEALERIPKSFLERLGLANSRTMRRSELEQDLLEYEVSLARKEFLKPIGNNALTRMKIISGGLPAAVGVGTVLRDSLGYKSGGKLKLVKKCKSENVYAPQEVNLIFKKGGILKALK